MRARGRWASAWNAARADWLATPAMRDELERVLAYAQIESRLAFYRLRAGEVLTRFDRQPASSRCPPRRP